MDEDKIPNPNISAPGRIRCGEQAPGKSQSSNFKILCYASLFTDRAISHREEKKFDHLKIALSAGEQKIVRADKAGVLFSIDTGSGFPNVVRISAAWGLGEVVVKGEVNPDEYTVFKPLLSKKETRPILEKSLGDKKRKVVYGPARGRVTRTVNTTKKERESFVLDDGKSTFAFSIASRQNENVFHMALTFEWDARKARSNLAKHGVSFEEASTGFADLLSFTIPDPDHSLTEKRYITMGRTFAGKLIVVVHTERGDNICIISARRASRRERRFYEEE